MSGSLFRRQPISQGIRPGTLAIERLASAISARFRGPAIRLHLIRSSALGIRPRFRGPASGLGLIGAGLGCFLPLPHQ